MQAIWELISRIISLFRKRRLEDELSEELRHHLELTVEENIRRGMTEKEAWSAARRTFGGIEQAKEHYRKQRGIPMIETLLQDLRYGCRMLIKTPAFTLIAVMTLALGIGANTAIFSVVNQVLLNPLPFTQPDRLVMVWNKGQEVAGGDRTPLAFADLIDWRDQNKSCEMVGAYAWALYNYNGGDSPERVQAVRVTSNFFAILGAQPILGRSFLPEEERPGAQPAVVISDGFWRTHFSADKSVIGRPINLNGASWIIVGVMAPSFDYPSRGTDLWTVAQFNRATRRGPYTLTGLARLKPGITLQQARAEMNTMKSSFDKQTFSFNVLPINDFVVGDVRPALLLILASVTLVLLIAVLNVANLMLVRGTGRAKEISIRAALGAGRGRIIRQLLTESFLLAIVGGAVGTLLAIAGIKILETIIPDNLPRLNGIHIDARVFGWTAIVSLATGIMFGLAPALQNSRLSLNRALNDSSRGSTDSAGKRSWRSLLVISELAMAVMLLIGAGLLINSFWRLQNVDPGVNTDRILTMRVYLPGNKYTSPEIANSMCDRVIAKIGSLPGVTGVALGSRMPADDQSFSTGLRVEGRAPSGNEDLIANDIRVSMDYFRTLNVPLRRGRYFTDADTAKSQQVMIVNDSMAKLAYPGQDPIGKRLNRGSDAEPDWWQIVGVVGDVKYKGLADDVEPAFYSVMAQNASWANFLMIKTESADPTTLAGAVRNEIKTLDSNVLVAQIETLQHHLYTQVAQPRFRTTLITIFALIALILASIGIYGVISYTVSHRTNEIGIRMALGAQRGQVLNMIIGQGLKLAVASVAIGLTAAFALTRLMKSFLFGVSATDPMTFVAVASLLMAISLLACYIPARRATKVDPAIALRHE